MSNPLSIMLLLTLTTLVPRPASAKEELLSTRSTPGVRGGQLVVAQRSQPKTLNPVTALDSASRDVFRRMHADLVHIDRVSQQTVPALAKYWSHSADGRQYTLRLRQGIRFSDGHSFDADDVIFSFAVYLDPKVHSPQRDLLLVDGEPPHVEKIDRYTVRVSFPKPYAAADRLFDSVAILPRHLLEQAYRDDKLSGVWTLDADPAAMAGLGPFRLKRYVPGEQIVLERNPFYWKRDRDGQRLPYLDTLTFVPVASEEAQMARFEAGESDVINRLSAENFALLSREQSERGFVVRDVGPSLEYNFLLFNLNSDTAPRLPEVARKQIWFRDPAFRRAVSLTVDRDSILKLVYASRATPLASFVTPGNRLWIDSAVRLPARSPQHARELLRTAGYSWDAAGALLDPAGQPVQFTILVSSSNAQRQQIATLVATDLAELGMKVQAVPMEFRAQLDRITQSHDYDAAVMALGSGDVDPTAEMNVWMSSGSTHLWHLGQKTPATPWEAEIDSLMQQQSHTINPALRKRLYDRVQRIVADQLPIVPLISPHLLVGAKRNLGNFTPSILDHNTLSNVDELFWSHPR
jgi:peptide/nickel transport system substrate-binding protein